MKTKLIFVRHGELEGENKKILHSSDDAVSISETGKEEAAKAMRALEDFSPSSIITSNERRTIETASLISKKLGIDIVRKKELEGRRWGEFAGKSWDEVGALLSGMTLDERYEFAPPGGESWHAFEGRLLAEVYELIEAYGGSSIVIVSHGSMIRALLPVLFKVTKEESLGMYPDYGSISTVDFEDGKFLPIEFNRKMES